jgi:hypothetical protein
MIGIILLAIWALMVFIVCEITKNHIDKNCLENPRFLLIDLLCLLVVVLGYSIGYYILVPFIF